MSRTNADAVKVISLEIENVKRVQAVQIVPTATGLTIIGGKNRQGKSSVLDAICAALGGERFSPSHAIRDGEKRGSVSVELSNGVIASRVFTPGGSRLEISGANNGKSGQALLNEFISVFALDLSKFLHASEKEKAAILLEIIGVDLQPYDEKEQELYQEREQVGRLKRKAQGHAESLPYHEEAGSELHTADSLMKQLQDVVTHNARNRTLRQDVDKALDRIKRKKDDCDTCREHIAELERRLKNEQAVLEEHEEELQALDLAYTAAFEKAKDVTDEDESDIRAKLGEIEELNAAVRDNLAREKAFSEVEGYQAEYQALSARIEEVRRERAALLEGAEMPLAGLSVENGLLVYGGKPWDCMSHAEQLIAATAICQATNPAMGFVLVDKLEAMDLDVLGEYRAWLETEGLQAITTRVSTGGECSLVIEDGRALTDSVKTDSVMTAGVNKPAAPVDLENPDF